MPHILLYATVMKCIVPPTFTHIMFNIYDFLLVPAKINVLGLSPHTLYSSLEPVESQKCYTLYTPYRPTNKAIWPYCLDSATMAL